MLKTPQTTFISSKGDMFHGDRTLGGLPVKTRPLPRIKGFTTRGEAPPSPSGPLTSAALGRGLHPVCGMSWDRMDPSDQLRARLVASGDPRGGGSSRRFLSPAKTGAL